MPDYPGHLAQQDERTAVAIERACIQLRLALKEMSHDRRSLFMDTDFNKVNISLLELQAMSADVLCALGKEIPSA